MTDETITVVLTMTTTRERLDAAFGADAEGRTEGITIEGAAAQLCRTHNPTSGYISWKIEQVANPKKAYVEGTGHDCDNCGTSDAKCWDEIFNKCGVACCATCRRTATHGQDD